MPRTKAKHYLTPEQYALARGMRLRGDSVHDIMHYFNENSGRYYDAEKMYPDIEPAPRNKLPPPPRDPLINPNAALADQISALQHLIETRPNIGSFRAEISPELAQWILEHLNHNNRKQRLAKIKLFCGHMADGTWAVTGDNIKFGRSGLLLDGQNRLAACVRAGRPFDTHLICNIDDEAFDVIDTGTRRTNTDTLKIAGVPHPAEAAHALRWIAIHEQKLDRGKTFENHELLHLYQTQIDKERLDWAVRNAVAAGKTIPPGNLAAYLYIGRGINVKAAERMAAECRKGVGGGLAMLKRFDDARRAHAGRVHEDLKNAWIIQAFNAYRQGKRITKATMNWKKDASEFPTFD